jgi:hypothetical protein
MNVRAEERPEYAWLKELKATKGEELRQRYGAHAVGIGRKRVGGKPTEDLALIFYVSRKRPAGSGDPDAIPPVIRFTPKGAREAVLLPTDVREAEPAEAEGEVGME